MLQAYSYITHVYVYVLLCMFRCAKKRTRGTGINVEMCKRRKFRKFLAGFVFHLQLSIDTTDYKFFNSK